MARLIDADALEALVKRHGCDKCPGGTLQCTFCTLNQFIAMIDSAPTIDAAPMRRGKWVKIRDGFYNSLYICQRCAAMCHGSYNFCPKCGADMRGECDE